ncbi:nucleotidyl transferase AbiEii/AbiGii toxin family protein [Elizabethkingia anophelis]|nr:nucleotidyl transferase AbiEii/AbiGii toxin family protein [Elizabethkingia anophelis]MCT3634131.1 nucleotidyl transferase AbiEii/AbiGii toxin family protein [Elizabethkingia anophelis]MCT3830859.1 nucleotidyl transferase AbiEii/AbiGii toxin family protein [Elizabethkingia anophelis]MCT3884335.1 nucleotidyl transferase AbiEii/AbiGii toxin family protein [Elizabethkingia anophelis]MCT3894846.1 nucleotidyl transferase AbiEii/AbiGii toxin family protein [Elizabethkingia anophelis]
MIKDWIAEYQPKTDRDYKQALREIMQQITLAGLYRGGFFEKAAFYGGTALRIFYGLNRFSEDLDFSLLQNDENFHLNNYLKAIEDEFTAQGMSVSIKTKVKSVQSNIESAFLKSETLWSELVLETVLPQFGLKETIGLKIKIEVDTKPPLGFETEEKLLLKPFSFYVKCFVLEDLFAGKMHALLFRKWGNNVKGRDWYDMEWYIRRGTSLNLEHFLFRAKDSGDWQKETMTEQEFRKLLYDRIETVNLETAKNDAKRFISDPKTLDIWSKDYFKDLIEYMKIN